MTKKHIFLLTHIFLLIHTQIQPTYDITFSDNSFIAHKNTVNCIQYHPSKINVFATASADKTIKVWNLNKEKTCQATLEHETAVTQLKWHPDPNKKHILASAAGKKLYVWNFKKEKPLLAKCTAHKDKINDIAWLQESTLASASNDKTVKTWTIVFSENDTKATFKEVATLDHQEKVTHLAWNAVSKKLATTCKTKTIFLCDTDKNTKKTITDEVNNEYTFVTWIPHTSSDLAYGSRPKNSSKPISKIDILNNKAQRTICFDFITKSADWNTRKTNRLIAAGLTNFGYQATFYGSIDIWDISKKKPLLIRYKFKEETQINSVDSVAWDPFCQNTFAIAAKTTKKINENKWEDNTIVMIGEIVIKKEETV